MAVRVFLAGAVEAQVWKAAEPVIVGTEAAVLAGEDQGRGQPAAVKRVRDRRQLDRFGPGADDQTNVGRTQPSP
jgi:hypothetical protein